MRQLDVRIEAALGTYDEDCRWDLIGGILDECPDDVLEAATVCCGVELERGRTLGADILGRLVGVEPNCRTAVLDALLAALASRRPRLNWPRSWPRSGTSATRNSGQGIFPLADASRRGGAARGRLRRGHDQPAAAGAGGADRPDPPVARLPTRGPRLGHVRAWHALRRRRPRRPGRAAGAGRGRHHEARAEALFGLAVRRDPRAVPHLIRALQSPLVGGLEVDAAAAADPRLLPALWALQQAGVADEVRVRRAIDRCSGRDRPALPS
jgi:hypothetical protein